MSCCLYDMLSASEASTVGGEIERQGQVFGLRSQRNQKDHTVCHIGKIQGYKGKKKSSGGSKETQFSCWSGGQSSEFRGGRQLLLAFQF